MQDVPPQCVFVGTTNAETFLTDETGARRFWPVAVGAIRVDRLAADRDQLWAEACATFAAGERWWLADSSLAADAAEQQAARFVEDTWHEAIAHHVAVLGHVTVKEILTGCLGIPLEQHEQRDQNRVVRALAALGWTRRQCRHGDVRAWRWHPPGAPAPEGADEAVSPGLSRGQPTPW